MNDPMPPEGGTPSPDRGPTPGPEKMAGIPPEILNAGNIYFGLGVKVQTIMVVLGMLSFIASLVVATFGDTFANQWITKGIAFVAALSAGLLTLFNLQKKNQEIWAAWRMLNAAILRYRYQPGYTYKDLIDTWEQAEKTLGNATINEK